MDPKLRIGLDFDGVIVDCTALKIEQARNLYQVDLLPHRAKEHLAVEDGLMSREQYRALMGKVCGTREVGLRMAEIDRAIERLKLLEQGGHELTIITSREGSELDVASEWLKIRGLEPEFVSIGYGKDKTEAAAGMDVYIDDDLHKLLPMMPVVPNLFLFHSLYNAADQPPPGMRRIHDWPEFYAELNRLQGI